MTGLLIVGIFITAAVVSVLGTSAVIDIRESYKWRHRKRIIETLYAVNLLVFWAFIVVLLDSIAS